MHSDAEAIHSSNGVSPAAQLDLGFAERRHSVLAGVEEVALPTTIVKRDGRIVAFDPMHIERAISRCFAALGRTPYTPIPELVVRVVNIMSARPAQPTVEIVQDAVELTLQAAGEFEAAKAYILYRAEHAKQRQERPVPDEVRAAFAEADRYFPSPIQKFQFFDKYSRFDYDKGRRETWIETVDRAVAFLHELVETNTGSDLGAELYQRLRRMILEMKSMPSMRLLAMAGPPARRDSTTIYNCSYLPVESIDAFSEALLISMGGCGVGFSVESHNVEDFPRIQRQRGLAPLRHTVGDSAQGWAEAVRLGMQAWFEGGDVDFNFNEVRAAGAPLRTKGGRASGPGPLRTMLEFARARVLARQGMHLRPIDAHDIMCMVGNAAVSGGVRRCLPVGSRVHTSRGAIPIEEVHEGDLVMTAHGYKPVTGWVDQGTQEVVEIVTESGTIFRCTPHHRVAVLTDVWGGHTFKYARDLRAEDRLLFITRPIDGQPQSLAPLPPKREADHSGSVVQQPVLDAETAWFLGKFLADGYAQVGTHDAAGKRGTTQFSVACNLQETEQIDRVTAWMERHGLIVQRLPGQGRWLSLRSSNRQIARWMQHYKRPNTPLSVPEPIWRATVDIRAAFVAGLMDGDGCFTDRPITVLATVYERFARQVATLLATLGIIAEVRQRRPATEQGWQAQWIVTVKDALALQRAEATVGAAASTAWVGRHGKQAGYSVPGWMVRRDLPRREWTSVWPGARDPDMNSATLTSMVEATHYVPVGVREVRPGGPAHTYDIEVRDGSMFVTEGYLVHNTAMISLFDYDDLEMRLCKSGDFEHDNSQRWNANNSAVWPEHGLDQVQVIEQVLDMVKSQRGEPGIFNRKATLDLIPERRKRFGYQDYGVNPCGEIVLRNYEFCNLSIAVARSDDTFETLKEKVEVATIIGTIQSLATHFPDLRPIWKKNCEEERLLGVDITGQMDCPVVHDPAVLCALREVAVETNRVFADRLGINQSAAITTVKPSGNSSQLLNCSSGLHARWAPYYERNVRVAATSPIFKVLRDAGVPMDPENGQTRDDANCVTPDTKVLTDDLKWVPAGDLKQGDGIIGFDDLPELGKKRRYRRATVTYAGRKLSRVLRITLDNGQVLRCTPDHKWLILNPGGTALWMSAEEMLRRSGRKNSQIKLPKYWNVCDTDTSYGAGYLAGLLDGEGYLGAVARTTNVGFIQNEGGVYTRGVTELEVRGYQVVTRSKQSGFATGDGCRQVAVAGGRSELLRLLSEVRPIRLVDKLVSRIHTLSLVAFGVPSISSVEEDGEQEIAVLSSSCQTYLAEGFAAHNTWVIHFPVKSPDGAVTRKDRGAIEQCNYWLHNKLNWTEHNPSVTITYKPDEIVDLTKWIWKHRDVIGGMAFLPSFDANYAQLPYIEITKEEYERRVAEFPEIDFSKLWRYEATDLTAAAQELACLAGQCEADL